MEQLWQLLTQCWTPSHKRVAFNGRRYHIQRLLGEGGFSFVYLVQDVASKKTYALKRMLCQTAEAIEDAEREIQMLRRFDHPNLLKMYDSASVKSTTVPGAVEVFILMPFYRLGTLQARISELHARGARMPESEVIDLFLSICQGMLQFHQQDPPLAHRDMKPDNILLADDRTAVLMDFGSAAPARVTVSNHRQALQLQEMAAQYCTAPYRAPELWNLTPDTTVDERVDVWSLGCILYCMCYLASPFESSVTEQGGSIALAVISGRVTYPTSNYSPQLVDLIKYMLNADHTARPSVQEVIQRIRDL